MKTNKVFFALLSLVLLACLSGVQGQYQVPPGPVVPGVQSATQYSQYYQMVTGPAPATHISAPQQFESSGNAPANVYFGTQGQEVPYSQLQSSPMYSASNYLWIQGSTSWTQYAIVPQGATVSLLTISSTGGNGYLSEVNPDGQTYSYNFFFYPDSHLSFYADAIGRHILSYVINGIVSNTVIIDVTGTYVPPSNYMPPSYYPNYYFGNYRGTYYNNFPGFFGFGSFGGTSGDHTVSSRGAGEGKGTGGNGSGGMSGDQNKDMKGGSNGKGGDENKGKNFNLMKTEMIRAWEIVEITEIAAHAFPRKIALRANALFLKQSQLRRSTPQQSCRYSKQSYGFRFARYFGQD